MICEVYGFSPTQVGELTVRQFNYMRDYAYRARTETLLGEHVFTGKNNSYKLPGVITEKPVDSFSHKIKLLKQRTGKSVLTQEDLKGII